MKRLLATLVCEIQLQYRNGFYYATVFVLAAWLGLFSQLPRFDLGYALPACVLGNLFITTFYFVGGLVLLEKEEGSLEARVVTPLRTGEYLAAKVITLSGLALVENLILVAGLSLLGFNRAGVNALPLCLGLLLAAGLLCLAGFAAIARYHSINEFLFPSLGYVIGLSLPFIDYFGLWRSPLFYLHPLQAPLLLLQAAFQPVARGQVVYGLLYSALWLGIAYLATRHAFDRFIIGRM
jgi:fluoroquinolone transport system permease protein